MPATVPIDDVTIKLALSKRKKRLGEDYRFLATCKEPSGPRHCIVESGGCTYSRNCRQLRVTAEEYRLDTSEYDEDTNELEDGNQPTAIPPSKRYYRHQYRRSPRLQGQQQRYHLMLLHIYSQRKDRFVRCLFAKDFLSFSSYYIYKLSPRILEKTLIPSLPHRCNCN